MLLVAGAMMSGVAAYVAGARALERAGADPTVAVVEVRGARGGPCCSGFHLGRIGSGPTGLEEHIGCGVGIALRVEVADGAIHVIGIAGAGIRTTTSPRGRTHTPRRRAAWQTAKPVRSPTGSTSMPVIVPTRRTSRTPSWPAMPLVSSPIRSPTRAACCTVPRSAIRSRLATAAAQHSGLAV